MATPLGFTRTTPKPRYGLTLKGFSEFVEFVRKSRNDLVPKSRFVLSACCRLGHRCSLRVGTTWKPASALSFCSTVGTTATVCNLTRIGRLKCLKLLRLSMLITLRFQILRWVPSFGCNGFWILYVPVTVLWSRFQFLMLSTGPGLDLVALRNNCLLI